MREGERSVSESKIEREISEREICLIKSQSGYSEPGCGRQTFARWRSDQSAIKPGGAMEPVNSGVRQWSQ